jgi:competence protein ComEA
VATPAPTDDRLDINTARLDQLVRLPGVGADLAVKIFTYRAGQGPFASTADLGAVSGVGAAKLRKLEELVFVPSALEPAEESPVAEAVEPEVEDTPAEGVVDAAADDAANVAEAAPVGAVEAAVDVMAIDGEPIEPDEGDVAAGSAVVDEIPPIDASGDAREPDSEVPSPEDAVDEVAIDGEPIERDEGDVAAGSAVVAEIEDAGVVDGVDDGVAGATLVDASAADAEVIVETPPIDASGDAREPDSEVPSPEGAAERGERPPVDINWADATQLISVPGIGPQLAERILSYRDQHGFFTTIDGLANVRGVSSSTVDRLRRYITV